RPLGFRLRLLGLADPALDLLGPLGVGLFELRDLELPQDEHQDPEPDKAEHDLGGLREYRVVLLGGGQEYCRRHLQLQRDRVGDRDQPAMKNSTKPISARTSTRANVCHAIPISLPWASG